MKYLGKITDPKDLVTKEYIENNFIDMLNLIGINPIKDVSTSFAFFRDGAENLPIKSLNININPQQSGSNPTPNNPRTIEGLTRINIFHSKKNIFDEANATLYPRFINMSASPKLWSYDAGSRSVAFPCEPNTTYTVSCLDPSITPAPTVVQIIVQPTDAYAANVGDTLFVSVAAVGDGLTYQWYMKAPGGSSFTPSSITADTYSVVMDASKDGRQVYCVVTDAYGNSLTSNIATLSIGAPAPTPLEIIVQPTNVYVEKTDDTATVSVVAAGDGLTYQWYLKNPNGSSFTPSSIKTAVYSVVMDSTKNGRQVYCVITDAYGNSVTSNIVTLVIATITVFRAGWIEGEIPTAIGVSPEIHNPSNIGHAGSVTLTTGAQATYIIIQINAGIMLSRNARIQIEINNTATPYESYYGNTYLFDWENEAGTIYKGTLEYFENGNYRVTVTDKILNLGNLDWTFYSNTEQGQPFKVFYSSSLADCSNIVPGGLNSICEQYTRYVFTPTSASSTEWLVNIPNFNYILGPKGYSDTPRFYVRNDTYGTDTSKTDEQKAASLKTSLNNVYATYPLATPIVYNYVSNFDIKTFYGINNFWADIDNFRIKYYADTALFFS